MKSVQPRANSQGLDSHPSPSERVVLRASGLRKAFGGQVVLDDVDLTLREGEIVLLRGDNGSGKTTLLNILTGSLAPDDGTIRFLVNGTEETFRFPRRWWEDLNPFDRFTPERVAREGVGREWQDIRLFESQSLGDNVAVAIPLHPGENPVSVLIRPSAVRHFEQQALLEAHAILDKLGLKDRCNSSADRISLGQAKRVAIARAVEAGARILFLDEPLAGMDDAGADGVINLLKDLAYRRNVTLVIVEHVFNVRRILNFATSVWTIQEAKISIQQPARVALEVQPVTAKDVLSFMQPSLASQPKLASTIELDGATLSVFARNNAKRGTLALEVINLVVHRGNRPVLGTRTAQGVCRGVSFSLHHGDLAVLLAPNGWGKTTLFDAIAGTIRVTSGEIRLDGHNIHTRHAWERAALGVSLLQSQHYEYPNLTVEEVLRLCRITAPPKNVQHLLQKNMSTLSGGEKRKVALVAALAPKPSKLLLLDEPFSNLDQNSLNELSPMWHLHDHSTSLIAFPSTEK